MPAMDYSKVAEIYDCYAYSQIDVPFFVAESRGCRHVLELTSGTGRLSIPLIQAGVLLVCMDQSPEMLAVLKKKLAALALSADIYEMDVCRLNLPEKFDLIIFPFNSFSEIWDPARQKETLIAITNHLAPTGRFICTLHNPTARLKRMDGHKHVLGRYPISSRVAGQTLVLSGCEQVDPKTGLVEGQQYYEIFDPSENLLEAWAIPIRFALFTQQSFLDLITQTSLRPIALYGDYDYSEFKPEASPYMIWILKRG